MNHIFEAALRMSLVPALALGLSFALKRGSAALRHWVLTVGIVCGAVTPLLYVVAPSWPVALPAFSTSPPSAVPTSVATELVVRGPARPSDQAPGAPAPVGHREPPRVPMMLALSLWMSGALGGLVILGVGLRRLSRSAAAARPLTEGRLASLALEVREAAGISRQIMLLQSREPMPLATWGTLRPRLILPADSEDWSDDRARVVLRHEFAHIARGDWLAQMLAETLRAICWFNPLLWIISRRLRHESERACDDAVLRSGIEAADYASHLLELARRAQPRATRPALAMARPSSLEGRVRAMLSTRISRRPLRGATRLAAFAALAALTVPVAVAQNRLWSFTGTVVDQTNRSVPDATLVLANEATRAKYEVRTDSAGHFDFKGLPAGDYVLAVQKPGFKPFKDTLAVLASNLNRRIALEIGTLQETISVTGPTASVTRPTTDSLASESERQARREQARQRAQELRSSIAEKCGAGMPAGNVGGQVQPPLKLVDVRPNYAEELRAAGVAGRVVLHAVIATDGSVREIEVVSSPNPDLEHAAIEAVRQWEFSPTYLNCAPIEVEMQVTVNFQVR